MALKAKLTKAEHTALDATLQKLYVEKAGAFALDVEGMVGEDEYSALDTKLAEFRDNNRKLHTDLKKFEGIDPVKYAELEKQVDALKKAGVDGKDITAVIKAAVDAAVKPLSDKLEASETAAATARRALDDKTLDDRLWEIGVKAGVRETARRDFLGRAREIFKLEEGKIVAKNGDQPVFSKQRGHQTDMLTPEEWATKPEWLLKDADHLFKSSTGGGARGNDDRATNGARLLSNDQQSLGAHGVLEDIASGKAVVAGT